MSGEHIGHQQFLKRRTHCHEHEIGPDACHIVNQGRTLGSVAKISVVLSYDADSRVFPAKLLYRGRIDIGFASDYIKRS